MEGRTPAEKNELRSPSFQLFRGSMKNEARRLRTFWQWPPTSPVCPQDLVKGGFFFLGPRDEVQCFCCGGVLKDWHPGDCPAAEHQRFFPSCKFICGEDVGNQELLPLQQAFDTVDGQFLSLLPGMDSEETALPSEPQHPEMETEEMRLSTFENWPQYTDVCPEQLARAGFFYTGPHSVARNTKYTIKQCLQLKIWNHLNQLQLWEFKLSSDFLSLYNCHGAGQIDIVRCFHCDGGVRSWSFGDDPWREHAKWYPGCEFLLRSRGRAFVNRVQESFSSTLSPRDSWDESDQDSSACADLLQNWGLQALSSWHQSTVVQNVLRMGFDPIHVARLVDNKCRLTRTSYLSEAELVSDLLQPDWAESSSAEASGGAVQSEPGTSSSREAQSVWQKESDTTQMSTEQQLQRLQEERICKVCMEKDVSVVFVPCGHLIACRECALGLKDCPICREFIERRVRTFMS